MFKAEGPEAVSPLMGAITMSNAASSNIAFRLGLRGVCESISSGCASGTHAIGDAAPPHPLGHLRHGNLGGSDAPRSQEAERGGFVSAALRNLRVHSDEDVVRLRREALGLHPLRRRRRAAARGAGRGPARGARIYAEVVGYGNTLDGYDLIAPEPSGEGVRRCMQAALDEAGLSGADVRFVNTHGTATRSNDMAETLAIRDLCGLPGPAVNSIKGVTGHSGPAAGALEAASVALTIHRGIIPPTVGLKDPSPDIEVDLVYGEPRPWEPGLSLSTSLGLGGHTRLRRPAAGGLTEALSRLGTRRRRGRVEGGGHVLAQLQGARGVEVQRVGEQLGAVALAEVDEHEPPLPHRLAQLLDPLQVGVAIRVQGRGQRAEGDGRRHDHHREVVVLEAVEQVLQRLRGVGRGHGLVQVADQLVGDRAQRHQVLEHGAVRREVLLPVAVGTGHPRHRLLVAQAPAHRVGHRGCRSEPGSRAQGRVVGGPALKGGERALLHLPEAGVEDGVHQAPARC